jgi:hypothetical protein
MPRLRRGDQCAPFHPPLLLGRLPSGRMADRGHPHRLSEVYPGAAHYFIQNRTNIEDAADAVGPWCKSRQ